MSTILYAESLSETEILQNKINILQAKKDIENILNDEKLSYIKIDDKISSTHYIDSERTICGDIINYSVEYYNNETWNVYQNTKWYKPRIYLFEINFDYLSKKYPVTLEIFIETDDNQAFIEQILIPKFKDIECLTLIIINFREDK